MKSRRDECYSCCINNNLSFSQPENILLKNDQRFPEIRLIDFGLSRRVDVPYSQYDIVGTPEYVG